MAQRRGSGSVRRRTLRALLAIAGALLLSAILSVPAALLLLPLWSWLESSTGIKATGHSGPAEWCYLAVFGILASAAALYLLRGWADVLRKP